MEKGGSQEKKRDRNDKEKRVRGRRGEKDGGMQKTVDFRRRIPPACLASDK